MVNEVMRVLKAHIPDLSSMAKIDLGLALQHLHADEVSNECFAQTSADEVRARTFHIYTALFKDNKLDEMP